MKSVEEDEEDEENNQLNFLDWLWLERLVNVSEADVGHNLTL